MGQLKSSESTPTVLVLGATGSQGGALAYRIRRLGWGVRALVRNPNSDKAKELHDAGVQIISGGWNDDTALSSALRGCDKLFLCLLPDFSDQDRERRDAERIVKAAKAAGVTQVVASTSLGVSVLEDDGADRGISRDSFMARHLAGKKGVEDAVRNGGFASWTVVRPAFFMANFLEPKVERYPEPRDCGTWTTAMTPMANLALVDHEDIAAFVVQAFLRPDALHGRAVGLASEMMTVQQALDELGRQAGRPFHAVCLTEEEITARQASSNVFTDSQLSMRYMAKYVCMDEIESVIRPARFREFLERESDAVRKTYPPL